MANVIVKSTESSEALKKRIKESLGGEAAVTEREGGDRIVQLTQDQLDRLNRMTPESRNAALGGNVRQMLND